MPAGSSSTVSIAQTCSRCVAQLSCHEHGASLLIADIGFSHGARPGTTGSCARRMSAYVSNACAAHDRARSSRTHSPGRGASRSAGDRQVVSPAATRPALRAREGARMAGGRRARSAPCDPRSRSASVYRPTVNVRSYTEGTIDLGDAVPGWKAPSPTAMPGRSPRSAGGARTSSLPAGPACRLTAPPPPAARAPHPTPASGPARSTARARTRVRRRR